MPHITFIHGMANKPDEKELLQIWRRSLADGGLDVGEKGISTEMIYWADVLYSEPVDAAQYESEGEFADLESISDLESVEQGTDTESVDEFVGTLLEKMEDANADILEKSGTSSSESGKELEGFEELFPRVLVKSFLKRFLKDVHHYLFNVEFSPKPGVKYKVQDEIRSRFLKKLAIGQNNGPHILVSHSMGTVIAYDCLKRVPECPSVDGFMTIGSPLGMTEIQNELKPEWTKNEGYPSEKLNGSWSNIYDRLDVVARMDPRISNDYKKSGIETALDINEQNEGLWRHDISKYLKRDKLIAELSKMLGVSV